MAVVRTQRGAIVAFDDALGYGDVQSADDQRTYFFHCTQIGDDSRTIAIGADVTFRVEAGRLGTWEAVDVLPIGGPRQAVKAGAASFSCPVCDAPVPGEAGHTRSAWCAVGRMTLCSLPILVMRVALIARA